MRYFFPILIMIAAICGAANALKFDPPAAPMVPPEPPLANEILLYPPRPALNEYKTFTEEAGYFSLHKDAELNGFYMFNRSGSFGLLGGMLNFRFKDPYQLGNYLGLAEDALEYKAGGGMILGFDVYNRSYFSIPVQIETMVYLREGSFFGFDPFLGAGLNMNLLGSDWQIGGFGLKIFCGVLKEVGPYGNKVALSIGYGGYQINNARNIEGLFFEVSQPIRL